MTPTPSEKQDGVTSSPPKKARLPVLNLILLPSLWPVVLQMSLFGLTNFPEKFNLQDLAFIVHLWTRTRRLLITGITTIVLWPAGCTCLQICCMLPSNLRLMSLMANSWEWVIALIPRTAGPRNDPSTAGLTSRN